MATLKRTTTRDIAIDIATVDQFFNAPAMNPLSTRDVELLGSSGLSYIVRQIEAHRFRRDWKHASLVVRLPPNQITSGSESQLVDATRRYCQAKIADNALEIRVTRIRCAVALAITGVFVVALIAAAYILFTGALSGVSETAQYLVAGIISLFSWVVLWDLLEALIFNPIPLQRENAALRRIAGMDMRIEPACALDTPDAVPSTSSSPA